MGTPWTWEGPLWTPLTEEQRRWRALAGCAAQNPVQIYGFARLAASHVSSCFALPPFSGFAPLVL